MIQCSELLLSCGADVNAQDASGWTPLHAAAATLQSGFVELLALTPKTANARDRAGRTPLHLVAAALFKRAGVFSHASERRDVAETMFRRASTDAIAIAQRCVLAHCYHESTATRSVRRLLRIGGSETVTQRDAFGESPLGLACSSPETFALATVFLEWTDEKPRALPSRKDSKLHNEDKSNLVETKLSAEDLSEVIREAVLAAARTGADRTLALLVERAGHLMTDGWQHQVVEIAAKSRSSRSLTVLVNIWSNAKHMSGRAESWTVLHWAACYGDTSMSRLILECVGTMLRYCCFLSAL